MSSNNPKTKIPSVFTDDVYANQQKVKERMQMASIDYYWQSIVEYRSQYARTLPLTMVNRESLKVVITPKIGDKINRISAKLSKATRNFNELDPNNHSRDLVRDEQYFIILRSLATRYKLYAEDGFIRNVIRQNVSAPTADNLVLINYYNVLRHLDNIDQIAIDEDFIARLYEIMNGGADLIELYRSQDINDPRERAQVNRVYIYAPVTSIESMIEQLIAYIKVEDGSLLERIVAGFFYFNYIRPFTYFSEELAFAFLKAMLAKEGYDDIASLLTLEVLLSSSGDQFDEALYDVKKFSDLTYLLSLMIDVFDKALDAFNDRVVNVNKQLLINENYGQVDREVEKVAPTIKQELPPQFHEEKLAPTPAPVVEKIVEEPVKPVEEPVRHVEEPIKRVEEIVKPVEVPVYQHQQVNEVVKEEPAPLKTAPAINLASQKLEGAPEVTYENRIALSTLPMSLSEEDAQKLEQHLLELNPTLRRGEAYFYARHCTIGKFYTIDQFKKAVGCAYETARTSMDHLAEQGYYRKEQLKNKYIYTPLPRRS